LRGTGVAQLGESVACCVWRPPFAGCSSGARRVPAATVPLRSVAGVGAS